MSTLPPINSTSEIKSQKKKKSRGWKIALYVGAAILLLAIGSAMGGNKGSQSASAPTVTVTAEDTTSSKKVQELEGKIEELRAQRDRKSANKTPTDSKSTAQDNNSISGNETFLVGKDIQPGTYRSEGNSFCYWERASNPTGNFDSIIANENVKGTGTVQILPNDGVFKTRGCNDWKKVR